VIKPEYSKPIDENDQKERIGKLKVTLLMFSVFGIIFLIAIAGQLPNGYVDADGIENWFQFHFRKVLLAILLIDIILTFGCFMIIKRMISDTIALILTVSLFSIMCYLFLFLNSKSSLGLINRMGSRSSFEIHGVVMNKLVATNRKRTNHFYAITVTDTLTTRNYYFNVSDYIYKRSHRGDVFNKTFYRGQLNIIYRKEEE